MSLQLKGKPRRHWRSFLCTVVGGAAAKTLKPNALTTTSITKVAISDGRAFGVVVCAAHGLYTGQVVTITGANDSYFNLANVEVTVLDVNTFRYQVSDDASETPEGACTVQPHVDATAVIITADPDNAQDLDIAFSAAGDKVINLGAGIAYDLSADDDESVDFDGIWISAATGGNSPVLRVIYA